MRSPLSSPQQRVFDWIEDYIAQHTVSPSYREIQKGLGYRSPAPIEAHVKNLALKGFLSYVPKRSRSISILRSSRSIPLLGAISAHSLVETFPDTEVESLPLACLPKFSRLSKHELSQHFALRVRGDSMIGALIDDGDVVVLRQETDPRAVRNGTIVAARVQGATTLKYFYRQGRAITLKPANPRYEPTTIDEAAEEVHIQGVYVGLLRGVA